MDEKSWHGVREHLVGEFWVILLAVEPPSQTETLAQIESKSADEAPDVAIRPNGCLEGMGEDVDHIEWDGQNLEPDRDLETLGSITTEEGYFHCVLFVVCFFSRS